MGEKQKKKLIKEMDLEERHTQKVISKSSLFSSRVQGKKSRALPPTLDKIL